MKSFSKNIVYYGLSIVLMKGLSLIMLPFIAHQLSPEELGQLELLTTFAIFMSLFVAAGLEDCLFRFASNEPPEKAKKIIASLYGWSLVFGAVFYAVAWLSSGLIAAYSGFDIESLQLKLVWAGVALEGAITLPLAVMRMRDQAGLFFTLVLGRTFLQALLTVLFLLEYGTVTSVLAASLIATLSQGAVLAIVQGRTTGIAPNTEQLTAIFRYGMPLVLSGLCLFALNGIDRVVIAKWTSMAELGLYSVGAKFALATVLLMQPFGMWWRPKRFTWLNQKQNNCGQMLVIASVLLTIIMISVSLGAPVLITWLMPAAYQMAGLIAIGMVAVLGIREFAEIFNLGLLSQNNTFQLLMVNLIAALLGVVLCFILTMNYGVFGAVVALLATQCLRTGAIFYLSQQTHYLRIPLGLLTFLMIVTALVFSASFALTLYSEGIGFISYSLAIWLLANLCLWAVIYTFYQQHLRIMIFPLQQRFTSVKLKTATHNSDF